MGVFDFIASLVGSVAWPIVVLAAVYILRSQIRAAGEALLERIPHVSELNVAGASVKFTQEANTVLGEIQDLLGDDADNAGSTPEHSPDAQPPQETVDGLADDQPSTRSKRGRRAQMNRLSNIVDVLPPQAVTGAYLVLEEAMYESAEALGWVPPQKPVGDLTDPAKVLIRAGKVPPNIDGLLRDLRRMRNQASHARTEEVTPEAARSYLQAVDGVLDLIDQ